jgi:hypothetical protein
VCIMITSALLRTETERWREMSYLSSSGVLSAGFLAVLAWHDTALEGCKGGLLIDEAAMFTVGW